MDKVDKYFKLQEEIYEYFGYVEDWCVIPIDDSREYYWKLYKSSVLFAEEKEDVVEETGNHYCNDIYTQRFLPRYVYRAEDYTMVCVDTNTDGNKFLQIFDNSKEVPVE